MIIENTTPIAALTVGDLKELLRELGVNNNSTAPRPAASANKRYVYGLKGIQSLFGCSHLTAQRYKDTFLAPAVMQQTATTTASKILFISSFLSFSQNAMH